MCLPLKPHTTRGLKINIVEPLCYAKTDPQVFVVVTSEEGFAGTSPSKPSFGMTPTIDMYWIVLTDYILELVSYQKKVWLGWCQVSLLVWQWQRSQDLFLHTAARPEQAEVHWTYTYTSGKLQYTSMEVYTSAVHLYGSVHFCSTPLWKCTLQLALGNYIGWDSIYKEQICINSTLSSVHRSVVYFYSIFYAGYGLRPIISLIN